MTEPRMHESNQIWMIFTYTFPWNVHIPLCGRFLARPDIDTALLYAEYLAWRSFVWGNLVFLGIVLFCGYCVYKVRIRRAEVELAALYHKQLSERANIAIDLNDSLLQTIEASKLIADDALDTPADLHRTRSAMGRLSYWLGNAIPEGQAILNSLRDAGNDGNDLASGFLRAAGEFMKHRPFACSVDTTGVIRDINPIVRDQVYLLGSEVIGILCKHACPDHLQVALKYGTDFCLQVRSHRQTLNPDVAGNRQSSVLDLHDLQRRAQRIGATLNSTNASSFEVELTLTVPGNILFTNSPNALLKWLMVLWNRFRL